MAELVYIRSTSTDEDLLNIQQPCILQQSRVNQALTDLSVCQLMDCCAMLDNTNSSLNFCVVLQAEWEPVWLDGLPCPERFSHQ